MDTQGGQRTQGERDAITVEIGYALCSAVFAAAVLYGAVAGPAHLFDPPPGARGLLVGMGTVLAVAVFLARVVSVLVRFGRGSRPGRPGRTSPDS
ncbi:DUF6332 family protein [Streptomyces sp. NPDC016675]|uniref:DUF6332 family protein n=1 Tax=Streptomyces sp. NPDC016675 TaxID=3364970 RepID=UPI0036FDD73F